MGQYHLTVNLDKREYLHPHKLGDGLKLWEQLNSASGTGEALLLLLACSNGRGGGDICADEYRRVEGPEGVTLERIIPEGKADLAALIEEYIGRWAGDRIAVVGDYAEGGDLAPEHEAGLIYNLCQTAAEKRESVAHYRKLAGEAQQAGGELYHVSAAGWEAKANNLAKAKVYRDITDDILPVVEYACGVKITGDGWRDKEAV